MALREELISSAAADLDWAIARAKENGDIFKVQELVRQKCDLACSLPVEAPPVPVDPFAFPAYLAKALEQDTFVVVRMDDDQRIVFGWANVTKLASGEIVVDSHGDYIETADLEAAAYGHVLKFRATGKDHVGGIKGQLVESFMVTPEKLEAIGLEKGSLPEGWWVGYHIDDDNLWKSVKKGEYASFSIQGVAETENGD